ncbi:heterochromatin protein 1-binding protein 3 isoform X1 [Hippocampus comes]|uniref:Heterochromatin protein 1-binding protein 3 n=1 Tax=Hippocampus comes TaxID=109280 RepID=A0A3Q2YJP0_HIPCM|nr:PREDICTED: heterochromatin protein 1-binding protein 3 isoform X1 [Hippocampus comes]XP_019712265.1 PREDICTED: heterochromatin protein 1-binding protein 3 isoform X1 [Hippocampus comes]
MPIRRVAATPTQEKPISATAQTEREETPEESPSIGSEQPVSSVDSTGKSEAKAGDAAEPAENGEKADEGAADKLDDTSEKKDLSGQSDKCKDCVAGQCATHCYVLLLRLKDGYKYKKAKVKKVKRTIPVWASVTAGKKLPVANYAGTHNRLDHLLIEAITSFNHRSGVSYQSVIKYIAKKCPEMELDKKKFHIKKAMKKQLEKGTIKQLKGKGLTGTFTIGKLTSASKKASSKQEALGDALPLIITRLCEPKEASYLLIKKYLEQHFPSLNIENRPEVLKSALVKAVERGQLEQITGKGASGTFQLKRTGNQVLLKGGTLEDAILAAITAMNEPKTCSTTTLRKYLVDANKDAKEYQLVANLRRTLTKCKVLGWMEQITGHGFTGTYRLCFPFYPSPTTLYPDKFNKVSTKPSSRSRRRAASDEDDSEEEEEKEEEEEESEEEAPVRKRSTKRPPPRVRHPPAAKKASRGRGRPLAKTSPAKKAAAKKVTKAKVSASKATTPVKRQVVAKRTKTPAVKRLNKRGSKRPATPEESPSEEHPKEKEQEPKSEVQPVAPKKRGAAKGSKPTTPAKRPTKRGSAKLSKQEDSAPKEPEEAEEPEAKKPAGRPASLRSWAKASGQPPAKKAAPGDKRSPRKSKRGKN